MSSKSNVKDLGTIVMAGRCSEQKVRAPRMGEPVIYAG